MQTISLSEANKKVLAMFNHDKDWKDLVKGKSIERIKEIWRAEYNIALCLVGEEYNIKRI